MLGRHLLVTMEVGEDRICAEFPLNARIEAGAWLPLRFARLHVFDRKTGAARPMPPDLAQYLDDETDPTSPAESTRSENFQSDARHRS